MSNSADTDGGLRERKRNATRTAITSTARALTAELGLGGFTVEEVCERVGISRRTFFNYFPAKEDAVLGSREDPPEELTAPFLAAGSPGPELSPTLLQDLVDLSVAHLQGMAVSRTELLQLKDAMATEPRLVMKVMQGTKEAEAELSRLIGLRESLPPDDPRVIAVVTVFTALIQRAGPEFFDPANTRTYREVLTACVEQARAVFSAFTPLTSPKESR